MEDREINMELSHILIVDDDSRLLSLLDRYLHQNKFRVTCASDGREARQQLEFFEFDLLIIDVMMPGETGIELINDLRESLDVPILLLTAMNEPDDRILGLESGADDYLSKPFSPKELIARIKAILRRNSPDLVDEKIKYGNLIIDSENHVTTYKDILIKLGPTEFKLLYLLLANRQRVMTRERIVEKIWTNETEVDSRTVDVHIKRLRATLKDYGVSPSIETIRSAGYKISEESYFE